MRLLLKRLFSNYGMAVVLLLLCLYYSWATYTTQEARGEAAGPMLVAQLVKNVPRGGEVMIVARTSEEDAQFATTVEAGLQEAGLQVAQKVLGDPRAARQALEKLHGEGKPLAAIATTPECAAWTVLQGLGEKYPQLGNPMVAIPQSYQWPTFLKRENLLNIANQIVVVAILAIGMTLVIVAGGIDLSVGSLIALSAVVSTTIIRDQGGTAAGGGTVVLACLAGVGMCGLIGLFSGVTVTIFRVPPFIGTLAVMQVASGLAFIIARGGSIYELPESLAWLGRGVGWLGIPHAVLLMVVLYVGAHIVMAKTPLGRYIYAIGGNIEAARLSGVRVTAVVIFVYVLSGALAGLGGVVLASQLKSGAPTYGLAYELYVIAAVVVGGASLSGGEGRIFGTLIGAFIIALIQNGMNLTGVESYTQKIVLGFVILGAVLLDMLKKRDWRGFLKPARAGAGAG